MAKSVTSLGNQEWQTRTIHNSGDAWWDVEEDRIVHEEKAEVLDGHHGAIEQDLGLVRLQCFRRHRAWCVVFVRVVRAVTTAACVEAEDRGVGEVEERRASSMRHLADAFQKVLLSLSNRGETAEPGASTRARDSPLASIMCGLKDLSDSALYFKYLINAEYMF